MTAGRSATADAPYMVAAQQALEGYFMAQRTADEWPETGHLGWKAAKRQSGPVASRSLKTNFPQCASHSTALLELPARYEAWISSVLV
jgi:hypothetical protein